MLTIETVLREVNREIVPQFEERLRSHLEGRDREWLIEQLIRLTLDAHSLQDKDRKRFREEEDRKRLERARRVRKMGLDQRTLENFISTNKAWDRRTLQSKGLLKKGCPRKGADLIEERFRTPRGQALLDRGKDMLYGLLFGDETTNTRLRRTQRELLTLTVPRAKSVALDFMKATTEMSALGTWQDPRGAANDMQADNVVLQVEYGETDGELVGNGVVLALGLINNLEINEEILYGRMENVEQTTLIT